MNSNQTFPLLSWSKIKLFFQCPRCFFKEQRLLIRHPGLDSEQFSLSNLVDELWKKELNIYREQQTPHPLFATKTNNALPFAHASLITWQDYKMGLRIKDSNNQFELLGVLDDLLVNESNELIVLDYKTTANLTNITCDSASLRGLHNQMQVSFYAYLLQALGYKVNLEAYIVYNLALNNCLKFNQVLNFKTFLLPCRIDCTWIDNTLQAIRNCLNCTFMPKAANKCKFCKYELAGRLYNEN